MKKILLIIAIIGLTFSAINYLYNLKLGAIPFLIIGIIFFILAYHQLSTAEKHNKAKEKNN